MSLRAKAYDAVRWTTVGVVGKILLQFMQLVILARLLAPAEIGAMAIAVSIAAFTLVLVDIGVSNALIHQQRISPEDRSGLYWLNLSAGALVALLFAVASQWVADFYREQVLRDVLLILSPYFLVYAAGQQLKVMAEKELLFSRLIPVELVAALTGFIVTIVLAWSGAGVRAVALGQLSGAVVFTVLAWRFLSMGWRPRWKVDLVRVLSYVRYGLYVIGNNLLGGVNGTADVFLAGRIVGVASLGGFSLPRDLMLNVGSVVNAVATRVGLPLMAKAQDDPVRLREVYLKTLRMTASVNIPVFTAVAVFAPEIVHIVFGARWASSAPLLQWLAVWGMLRSIGQPVGSLIFAVGRADLAFKWNLGWAFVFLPAWWVGLQYGLDGLVRMMVAVSVLGQLPNWGLLVRPLCGAGLLEYFEQILRPLVAALLTAWALSWLLAEVGDVYVRTGGGLLVGTGLYLGFSYFINREWLCVMGVLVGKRSARD